MTIEFLKIVILFCENDVNIICQDSLAMVKLELIMAIYMPMITSSLYKLYPTVTVLGFFIGSLLFEDDRQCHDEN